MDLSITTDGWRDWVGVKYGKIIRKRENGHGSKADGRAAEGCSCSASKVFSSHFLVLE